VAEGQPDAGASALIEFYRLACNVASFTTWQMTRCGICGALNPTRQFEGLVKQFESMR
jgi:hypothetical protein